MNNWFKVFILKLHEYPETISCIKMTGVHCFFLKAAVKSNGAPEDLIDRLTEYGHPNTAMMLSDDSDGTMFKL